MQDVAGKVAVITGGGSGIGKGMALAFAEAGMRVVVSDIQTEAAEEVAKLVDGLAVTTDVTKPESVQQLADIAFAEHGEVHLLCLNAGVTLGETPIVDCTLDDWRWILSVNLDGVVHGLVSFLPRMRDQAAKSHIVSTASFAGIGPLPGLGPYTASKAAIINMSEVLQLELKPHGIGVSVLCPGPVNSGILTSERNRPAELSNTGTVPVPESTTIPWAQVSMPIEQAGQIVLAGVQADDFYILTHAGEPYRTIAHAHADRVKRAFP